MKVCVLTRSRRILTLSMLAISLGVCSQSYTITTIAGVGYTTNPNNGSIGGFFGGDNGPAIAAGLWFPQGVALDGQGNLYIADRGNNRVRKINAFSGIITTVAGNGSSGYNGDGIPAVSASASGVDDVAVDSLGNVFFADFNNHRIRRVDAVTGIITTVAGDGTSGFSGDGGPATSAQISSPNSVAIDKQGNIYISTNARVRKVDAVTGNISTVAGGGANNPGNGGPATSAALSPNDIAIDAQGNIFIVETIEWRVRKVTAGTGIITTVAGGTWGFSGDGGPATSAGLNFPFGVAVDGAGNIYISDQLNQRIRKVTASTGFINTIAGSNYQGFSGDCGPATAARLYGPWGIVVDPQGDVYFADGANCRIRKLTTIPATAIASQYTVCPGAVTTLSVQGMTSYTANTYLWSNSATSATTGITPTVSGTHSVVVTNNIGCQSQAFVYVQVYPLPQVSVASSSSLTCAGYDVILTPGGASTYSVTGGSFTVNPAAHSSYTVTGTDLNGCQNTAVAHVSVLPLPALMIYGSDTICANETSTLQAVGANSYTWGYTSSGTTWWMAAPSIIADPNTSSTYTVQGTGQNGCVGSAALTLHVVDCLGTGEQEFEKSAFRIYPNPAIDMLRLETIGAGDNWQVGIFDLQGRELIRTKIREEIPVKDLAQGVYFLRMISEKGETVHQQKLIKQ